MHRPPEELLKGSDMFAVLVTVVIAFSSGYATSEVHIPPTYGWMLKVDADGTECWHMVYGYPRPGHVATAVRTAGGGYALIGNIRSSVDTTKRGGPVPWVVVTDSVGNLLWEREYLTGKKTSLGYGSSLMQLDDGGYVLAGWVHEFHSRAPDVEDVWVIRTDATGNPQWTKRLGDSIAVMGATVVQSPDGGFLVATMANVKDHTRIYMREKESHSEGMLVKLYATGNVEWARKYGAEGWRSFYGAVKAPASDYVVSGSARLGADLLSLVPRMALMDHAGQTTWKREPRLGTYSNIRSIVPVNDGYLLSGEADERVFQMRVGMDGDSIWAATYLEGGYCTAVPTADGGSVLVGATFKHGAGSSDGLLIKTDPLGKMEWYRTYGGTELDQFRMVFPTDDGGYILVGSTGSFTE